jgi:hypothetical protein
MRGLAIALLFVCVGWAGTALAQAPSTMSYQGVLTDAGGNIVPDGAYNLTFKIYDVPGAGAALWTENWFGVAVAKGGFSVLLGSSTPLALPFDKQYWLGIAVGGGGELTPRVQLASSPYGLSLRLPFTGTSADPNQTLKISNTGGGAAIVANPGLQVGTPISNGYFQWFGNGSASPYGQAGSYAGSGGYSYVNDESGSTYWGVEPDFDGIGAFWFMNGAGGSGAYYDAEQSSGAGAMIFYGPGSSTSFNTGDVGDNAVSLPSSAVSAFETLDEPGVSQGKVNGMVSLLSTSAASLDNVVGTSITIPAPGYVEVEISGQAGIGGLLGSNTTGFQIDETGAGAARDGSHYYFVGGEMPNTSSWWFPVSNRRTYYKGSAGTYNFYFTAYKTAGTSNWFWNPTITATYVPTGYGAVQEAPEVLSGAAAVGGDDQQTMTSPSPTLDLRELELRVAETQAAAERAQRQLVEARLQEQTRQRSAVTPAAAKKQ